MRAWGERQATLGTGNQPPYYGHSSSNGPIWAQYLSGLLSMPLVDYAVSGATSGGTSAKTPFVEDECGGIPVISDAVASMLNNRPAVPSLLQQVHSYVKQVGANGASPDAVYFIVGSPLFARGCSDSGAILLPKTFHLSCKGHKSRSNAVYFIAQARLNLLRLRSHSPQFHFHLTARDSLLSLLLLTF